MTSTEKVINWHEGVKLILPKDHGSWSLAFEPIALGLLIAPTLAGVALTVAVVAGFFMRRPMKLALTSEEDDRHRLALSCVLILGLFGFSGLFLAARLGTPEHLWPLLPSVIAGAVFAWYDCHNGSREGLAEVAGVAAFGILPAAFAALAGWQASDSVALALVMLVRCVPTVMLVRTCVRKRKGRGYSVKPTLVATGAGIFVAAGLAAHNLAPWTALLFALLLGARAIWLLFGHHDLKAKRLGIMESGFGVFMVAVLFLTWKSHIV